MRASRITSSHLLYLNTALRMLAGLLNSTEATQVLQSRRILLRKLARMRCREGLSSLILLGLLIGKILLQVFTIYLSFHFEFSSFLNYFL
jgi:hypothetical protein